jgi:hypothetical protein
MRRTRRPGVTLLLLAICSSCWGYPTIGINVARIRQDGLSVHVKRCDILGNVPGVIRLEVRTFDDPNPTGPPLCGLVSPNRGTLLPLSEWEYGGPTPGFQLVGRCETLPPGHYVVSVTGSGGGSRGIVIDIDGGVRQQPSRCSP